MMGQVNRISFQAGQTGVIHGQQEMGQFNQRIVQ
jgi:hypothetical protein